MTQDMPRDEPPEDGPITDLLHAWSERQDDSGERLFQEIYSELHRLARGMLITERKNHTLRPTALLNEAFLRFSRQRDKTWTDRRHFMAVAAQAMRRVLIDHARRRLVAKRNQGIQALPLEAAEGLPQLQDHELIALDDALTSLRQVDAYKAHLVDLRFFGGFSIAETAQILGCGHGKIERQWRLAQGWLYRQLAQAESP